jgi:hypothetical protein
MIKLTTIIIVILFGVIFLLGVHLGRWLENDEAW